MPIVPFINALWPVPGPLNLTTYIQGNSDYEILCLVLQKLNEVIHSFNSLDEAVTELSNKYDTLEQFVNDYFDNLDVQTEINNKIDELWSDGTLGSLFTDATCVNNVKQFGAVGDANYYNAGTNQWYSNSSFTEAAHDDTDAIQAAINAASTNGFPILIPTGRYLITKQLTIGVHTTINGSGTNSSIIIPAYEFNDYCIRIGTSSAIQNVNISNISFNAQWSPSAKGITAEYLIYTSSFKNIAFNYFSNTVFNFSSGSDASENIVFENIYVHPNENGIQTSWFNLNRLHETVFTNLHLVNFYKSVPYPTSSAPMIAGNSISGVTFTNCDFFYCQNQPCISVNNYNGVFVNSCTFENNTGDNIIDISGSSIDLATYFSFYGNRRNIGNYSISVNTTSTATIIDPQVSVTLSGNVYNSIIIAKSCSGTATRSMVLSYDDSETALSKMVVSPESSTPITIDPQSCTIKMTVPSLASQYNGIQAFGQYGSADTSQLRIMVNGKSVQTFNTNGIVLNSVSELPVAGYDWRFQIVIYQYEPYICVNSSTGTWFWKKLTTE